MQVVWTTIATTISRSGIQAPHQEPSSVLTQRARLVGLSEDVKAPSSFGETRLLEESNVDGYHAICRPALHGYTVYQPEVYYVMPGSIQ